MTFSGPEDGGKRLAGLLLFLLVAVPLLPNPGLFTNSDSPKWGLLVLGTLVAIAFAFVRAIRSKEEITVLLPEHLVVLTGLVILSLVSGKRAPDARATIRALAGIGTLAAFGLLTTGYLRDRVRPFVLTILAAAGVTALIGLVQTVMGEVPTATFGNQSFAAEFVAGAMPLAVFFALTGRRAWFFLGSGLCILFLVLAKSRADWLGALAGLAAAALVAYLPRLRRRPPAWALTTVFVVGAIALPFLIQLLPIPAVGRGDTVEIRDRIRASTIEMMIDHPGAGVGLEGFRAYYPKYRDPEEARLSLRREVTFPHNLTLSVAAETGVPGLLLMLGFLFIPIWSGIRTVLHRREDAFAPAAVGALVAILVSAQFSAPLRHPGSALLFFAVGALLVARRPRRFVAKLKGRYRRAMPVAILSIPVVTGIVVVPWHLAADHALAEARAAARPGKADHHVHSLLRRSIDQEPSPDALHRLAWYFNITKEPDRALATLDRLFRIAPYHELGRIERARALRDSGKLPEAAKILDDLIAARPGDDIALMLRCLIRGQQGDMEGSLSDLLAAFASAPLDVAERNGARTHQSLLVFEPAVIRTAERIGKDDPERALAILRGIGTGEADFYRAVVYITHQRLDEAMTALRSSLDGGFLTKDRLKNDPRLAPLYRRSDFQTLLMSR